MKKISLLGLIVAIIASCNPTNEETISFYEVPLVCGADPEIGCGSRVKPFFMETEKQNEIKESWINRKGTVIAIVWNENLSAEEKENIIQPLFEKYQIEADFISDSEKQKRNSESFFSNLVPAQKGKDKWYKGMDVDNLSIEEAGTIADSATAFAVRAGLITETEMVSIKRDIEEYMKTELVKVRTFKELTGFETDLKWKQFGYETYVKYVGIDRAEKIRNYFIEYQKNIKTEESSCEKNDTMKLTSEITCPYCGHKKTETMPTDACQLVYTCEKCKKDLHAKQGDCCVFCSYGDHKCPSMQEDKN